MQERTSEQITRTAKSNLAFAFAGLPRDRKRNLTIFYAYCRIVDDIADEPGGTPEEKSAELDRWKNLVSGDPGTSPRSTVEKEVLALLKNPLIDREAMLGIIEGCRSDILPQRFRTFDNMLGYTYQVASCVGIVSAVLFGAGRESRDYAIALGHALQITNILRDVGEDWQKEHRIYLPLDLMAQYNYSELDLGSELHNNSFLGLMNTLAEKAEKFYREAHAHYTRLSPKDRRALAPAVAMDLIYHDILSKMKAEQFPVLTKRFRISKWRKIRHLIAARFISRRRTPYP